MYFNIKRYLHGLSRRRLWLLLIFLPPLAYLVLSAIHADRFSVKQNISISKDSPVALGSTPMGDKQMGKIVSRPDDFSRTVLPLGSCTLTSMQAWPYIGRIVSFVSSSRPSRMICP